MSICVLAERYGVKGQTLRKQYKEKISDYRNWDQLEHAHDYLLYPENIGENLSLDETCLSNGDVYTILTNKAAKGRKGALVAMVRGVATDAVSGILRRLPHRKRLSVKTVTTDLSSAMMLTVRKVFPAAKYNRENDLYKFSKRNVQKSPFFRCLSSCLRISFKRLLIGV